jgi:hypothetical protein
MSVEAARAFLRGLPTEQLEEELTKTTNNDDPRAARMAEITNSVAAFNKCRGCSTKSPASVAPS